MGKPHSQGERLWTDQLVSVYSTQHTNLCKSCKCVHVVLFCFVLCAPFSLWRIITLATTYTLSHLHMCNPQNYGFMVSECTQYHILCSLIVSSTADWKVLCWSKTCCCSQFSYICIQIFLCLRSYTFGIAL